MRVTVVRPGDLGPAEAASWSRFQKQSPVLSNPFLSLTFSQAVGGFRPAARVAVVEEGGQIEAFLPFELASPRIAVPIGRSMNELQGFISSGAPLDARAIIRKAGLRGWRFLHVPAELDSLLPYHYDGTEVQCQVINLRDGYQAYVSSRRKQTVKRIAEKRRSLARQLGEVSFQWNSSRPEDLQKLIQWKAGKYAGAQRLFSNRTAVRIAEELAVCANDDCRGIVSVLSAGDRPVAAHLGLVGPWGLAWWFPSYDGTLSRFSPGTIMLFALAEEAANRGIAQIDLGAGQDGYKFSLANASYPVAGGAVWVSRAEQAVRRLYRQFRRRSVPAGHTRPSRQGTRAAAILLPNRRHEAS
jgi:CelD/BcsL family acetyltransferase involved in cellulose biosynthesis